MSRKALRNQTKEKNNRIAERDFDRARSMTIRSTQSSSFFGLSSAASSQRDLPPSDDEFDYDTSTLQRLGFRNAAPESKTTNSESRQTCSLRFPVENRKRTTKSVKPPKFVGTCADYSLLEDASVKFDSSCRRTIDDTFSDRKYKQTNLNDGFRHILGDASIQAAIDALAHANYIGRLQGSCVLARSSCLLAIASSLWDPWTCTQLHVFRIGDTLILDSGPNPDYEGYDQIRYRGLHFHALCTARQLPTSGQCPSYQQIQEINLMDQTIFSICKVDAQTKHPRPKPVEIELMKHPSSFTNEHTAAGKRFASMVLKGKLSNVSRFMVGFHKEGRGAGFMRPETGRYIRLKELEENAHAKLEDFDEGASWALLHDCLTFLREHTQPGNSYIFRRPLKCISPFGSTIAESYFELAASKDLWKSQCPDLSSFSLAAIWKQRGVPVERLLQLVASFLRSAASPAPVPACFSSDNKKSPEPAESDEFPDEVPAKIHPLEAQSIAQGQWATFVHHRASDPPPVRMLEVDVVVLTFSRHPWELSAALLSSNVAKTAESAGIDITPSWAKGAKIFVADVGPEVFPFALRPAHVVIYANDEEDLMASLVGLPCRIKKLKPDGRKFLEFNASDISMPGVSDSASSSSHASQGGVRDDIIEVYIKHGLVHYSLQKEFARSVWTV